MKTSIEKKEDGKPKDVIIDRNYVKAENVIIRFENNRLRNVLIDGDFNSQALENIVTDLLDNDWISLILDKKIPKTETYFFGDPKNHEEVHKKIQELIKKLGIVTYLEINEKSKLGHVIIKTVKVKYQYPPEIIQIKYVNNTIKKVVLENVSSNETKKALTEALNVPGLDRITPYIEKLSLYGRITEGINNKFVDFINTIDEPFELDCKNGDCVLQLKIGGKFLYFDNEIYPVSIHMKEIYPQVANFFPKEVTAILDRFSGLNTKIDFRVSTKNEYKIVFPKASTFLSKIHQSEPSYLSFGVDSVLSHQVEIKGSYERLDFDLDYLFSLGGTLLLPLEIVVYDNINKFVVVYKTNTLKEFLLEALKQFLRTKTIIEVPEGSLEVQNPENKSPVYYLLKYSRGYIAINKELLPTVLYNFSDYIRWR